MTTSGTLRDTYIRQWHDASDHARDGSELGGFLCNCERIVDRATKIGWLRNADFTFPFVIVCDTCGNKRCPRAGNTIYKCTGSNATLQIGVLDA